LVEGLWLDRRSGLTLTLIRELLTDLLGKNTHGRQVDYWLAELRGQRNLGYGGPGEAD
jgi:hypothetical protein